MDPDFGDLTEDLNLARQTENTARVFHLPTLYSGV